MNKKRKIFKWANRIVSYVLFITLLVVASVVLMTKVSGGEPELFGYQLKTVLSGSMEPEIQTGSIIAIKMISETNEFKKGDVITFKADENKLVTHRIVDTTSTKNGVVYTTKGDNNNAEDSSPVLAENVVGEYKGFTIPYLGYFIHFAQSPNGSIFLLILPGVLLLGYAGISIWRTLAQLEDAKKTNQANVSGH
ncbi:signal peptidase I [Virgibacillus pantothenticus]|uniref:Signal peptidase I n=1 Tax=Virgibacillus pantothenticus TaxID=1473 RepID=A0A0L0QML4_VIRPA|nr:MULTISPECIES: signal peptidase I [Virgibacillus]API93432.1 signal peptidase I [Virgibacillus sp. 6R]KNE19749.1 signal peptidase [Virgibacillus pantothenticus]MBS7430198.1 signal peptidase I [Virgibacillus sp. 19R1-5]MBU8566246.1 signal peptidase I [Virgibacillus pantothenticus]MBU8600671.1 signal peptidase I [Virgibacillus pantothenticus]